MTQVQLKQVLQTAYHDLTYFHNNIYSKSWIAEQFVPGQHMNRWCKMLENPRTCILAPRKHSKSYTLYSWLMWQMLRNVHRNYEVLYISYKATLASYHIKRLKELVANNPFFNELRDITHAEGVAKYQWPNGAKFIIEPDGILSFKRGRHPDAALLDDVLMDPTTQLDLGVIYKINNRVKEEVLSMPKEGGDVKIIGTAQTPVDFFFDMKRNPEFEWGEFPAIQDYKLKKVLWPQKFPYDRLIHIRDHEIGEKAFDKEYMVKPVHSADAFFRRDQILQCVNENLMQTRTIKGKNEVGAGWDVGKHSHPAYFTVFEFIPIRKGMDIAVQRMFVWMDGWEYQKQMEFVKAMVGPMRIDYCNFDNTRAELEGYYEKKELEHSRFFPITFTTKSKAMMSTEFERRVTHTNDSGEPFPLIQIINERRQIEQILNVNNALQAPMTHEGHGDSFFGIALALHKTGSGDMMPLADPENLMGFQ